MQNLARKGSKHVPGMVGLTYREKSKVLDLPTLQCRRYGGDMIESYELYIGGIFYAENGVFTCKVRAKGNQLEITSSRHIKSHVKNKQGNHPASVVLRIKGTISPGIHQ